MVATNPGVMCDLSQKAPIVLHESPMLEQVFGHQLRCESILPGRRGTKRCCSKRRMRTTRSVIQIKYILSLLGTLPIRATPEMISQRRLSVFLLASVRMVLLFLAKPEKGIKSFEWRFCFPWKPSASALPRAKRAKAYQTSPDQPSIKMERLREQCTNSEENRYSRRC